MHSSTTVWMGFAGLIYLVAGVFILRKEISAAGGWGKLITLGCVLIAVLLAVFAPEHFRGPRFIQNMVPSWMPGGTCSGRILSDARCSQQLPVLL